MTAHKIGDLFAHSTELKALSRQARRLAAVQQILLDTLPPALARGTRVKNCQAGLLRLVADHAAVAAKLKQLAPRLLAHARKSGIEVTGIRVEVQVIVPQAKPSDKSHTRGPQREAINRIQQLADRLDETPLKEALTRFAQRHRTHPGDAST
jgi:hypothetical protein